VNRIHTLFQQLRSQNRKALIPYITPEFPVRGTTVPLILGLEKAGASLIEVGIPFSDPIADGTTIQHSSHVAIQNGATVGRILESVRAARRETAVPIVLMGYLNPIFRYGMENFLRDADQCGIDGVIVPDLLPEESEVWRSLSAKYDVSNIFLVAPTTPAERIKYLDSLSRDFSYCVSVTGVTGARSNFDGTLDGFLQRVKANTVKAGARRLDLPVRGRRRRRLRAASQHRERIGHRSRRCIVAGISLLAAGTIITLCHAGPFPTTNQGQTMGSSIDEWRIKIDNIDKTLVDLLNERARYADEIGKIKEQLGLDAYSPKREHEVLENVLGANKGPLSDAALRRLFERIIDESRKLEREAMSERKKSPSQR